MIEFLDVTKRHGSTTVLDAVRFRAAPGTITGLVGRNGAGKSSLLRILLGLDRATSGSATIGGQDYRDLRRPLTVVGAVFDGSGAHPARRARDHVAWLADSNGIAAARVPQVLAEVGLAAAAGTRVRRFSLGMAQRLGIATALLGEPSNLVLDEPLNGLDPAGMRWLRELLRSFADRGGTVLLSSHHMAELAMIADDVAVLHQGRLVTEGPLPEVQAEHASLESAYFAMTGGL